MDFIIGNGITSKVERRKRIEGKIEVLKNQQKVKADAVLVEYANKKQAMIDATNTQISVLQNQIAQLKADKESKSGLLDKAKKVALDKVFNDYDIKITSAQNKVRRLSRFIKAEKENMDDVIQSNQPNAPRAAYVVLNESSTPKTPAKKTTKKETK